MMPAVIYYRIKSKINDWFAYFIYIIYIVEF